MLKDRLFSYSDDFAPALPKWLAQIWNEINVDELLTPTNADEVKHCFMETGEYFNPHLNYNKQQLADCVERLKLFVAGISQVLTNIEVLEENDSDALEDQTRAEFVKYLVRSRLGEALNLQKFLQAVIDEQPEKTCADLVDLYGAIDPEIAKFARTIAMQGWNSTYGDIESLTVVNGSEIARKRLRNGQFSTESVAQSLKTALLYLLKEPIMAHFFNVNGGFDVKVSQDFDQIGVRNDNGQLIVGVPAKCQLSGEDLLAVIGREIEGHFRTLAITEVFIRRMLGNDSPLLKMASVLARSLDDTMYRGFAQSCMVYVKGISEIPEPFDTLAISYAYHKHNFAETLRYVYRYCVKRGLGEIAARERAWDATIKAFRGQTNTAEHTKYAFLHGQVELYGFLAVENSTEDGYFYLQNLAPLEQGELQFATVGGWLDDEDFAGEIDCRLNVVDYMSDFY